ncbi:hypothetical protein AX16_008113 [Volvariella volvacea WC 439]|nr:hypothetical protein AX16_008113 [Volvariella volvacea WC 439]
MGNDGGSIPDRRDLVRTKAKAEQLDKANHTRARWFFCALSKLKLQEPIVSCELGGLYNKDSIIEYLLDNSSYGDGEEICGHIRSLKDVRTLKLTLNTAPVSPDESNSAERAQFVCPLTMKEMNGSQPFIYLNSCGCVFSMAGLKEMNTMSSSTNNSDSREHSQVNACPQCGQQYSQSEDIIPLNPGDAEIAGLRASMERRRALEPTKKQKKRKNGASRGEDGEPPTKKQARGKESEEKGRPTPGVNPSISTVSKAVMSGLAIEEAKRKAGMSAAIQSLYHRDETKKKKETFMTMGTFTRYA